jgi:2-polyprenyl-6-methoxyphenol hydroxylase-like FAD-dependent oxidoreductase
MAAVEKALVVGAGIGGLAAAAALAARGVEVEVVEARPDSSVYGVGINQPANSLRALKSLGVLERLMDVGAVYDKHVFKDREGELIVSVDAHLGGPGIPPNLGLTRRDLHDALIAAAADAGASVRYGTKPVAVEEAGDKIEVELADGTSDSYDLVAAFDGIHSEMRPRLFGTDHEPVHTGHAVWRVTKPRIEGTEQLILYQGVLAKAGHIAISEDLFYLLLVVPSEPGERPPRDQYASLLRAQLEQFAPGTVPAYFRESLKDVDDIVFSPLEEVRLPEPWHKGRVILAGDAAHAVMPHNTQGAAMAIEDGVVLAEEVTQDRDLESSLTAFEARRLPRVRRVQETSRAILDSEMLINSEAALEASKQPMAKAVPERLHAFEEFINAPA